MALLQAKFMFPPSPANCKLNAEWTADIAKATVCQERDSLGVMECKNTMAGWQFRWTGSVTTEAEKRSRLYEEIRQVVKNGEPVCDSFTVTYAEENWALGASRIQPSKSGGIKAKRTSAVAFA
ncbi:hypothetical protein HDU67_002303, partial [Dinochytrium kinnereticum]